MFGLFTTCMMIDQWDVVVSNVTHIDRLKGDIFEGSLDHSGINEVFGIGMSAKKKRWMECRTDWLSPFTKVCFPDGVRDDIMGFCRPCLNGSRTMENEEELDSLDGGKEEMV